MQAAAAPWRAVLRTTHLLVDPTRLAASSFHSTPVSSAKWKDKFDCKVLSFPPSPFSFPYRFGILSNILLGEDKDALQAMSCGQNESISDNPVGLFHPHQPIHSPCAQCAQRNGTELTGLQPVITGVRNIPGGFRARAAL